ncbi:MAG TPA: hypothetical protein VE782_15670, partial [Myxococcaceae bacterium]|nr:hypothetical protein [Myxococcaceae bacterium]
MSVLVAAACSAPAKDPDPDAGTDSGLPLGACTSPCGPNQTCDAAKHVCVDACQGLCLAGQICVNRNGTPTCEIAATTCSGSVCGEGQISCVADHCSCLPFSVALRDSCADQGGACHQIYNAVTQEGGACEDPRLYEFCAPNCAGGTCGHHCGAGQICTNIITGAFSICARTCSQRPCASGELCAAVPDGGSPVCLPNGVFPNQGCTNTVALPDGGTGRGPTVAGDLCFQLDLSGTPTEAAPTGTCSWVLV